METSSPLFKGATRPACVGGVPLKVFVINVGIFSLLAVWVWIPLLLLCPITHFFLKAQADKDEQIFDQIISFAKINIKGGFNRKFWGNVTSFSPKQEKKELFIFEKSKE